VNATRQPDTGGGRRRLLYATEPARALADAGAFAASLPLLWWAPRGKPHPVLVLPGLLASDVSTVALGGLGYPVVAWELGRNLGPTREVVDGLPSPVERLAARHGTPVSIVGWSLGGMPVPSTSVYFRWDGVVDWRACLQPVGPTSENVAVHGSHLGLRHNPAVLWVVADRLAQPIGGWRPFRAQTRLGLGVLFPPPDEPVQRREPL
jgi:hypothetical protein